jgi:NAD(P)-dependent dehydrogenase (short-subunit alcohol dehydrogenase family)
MPSDATATVPTPQTLIVGGTRGVGRAFAMRAAESGEPVSIIGRTRIDHDEASPVRYFAADVADQAALARTLDEVAARGPVRSLALFQRYRSGGDAWEQELATTLSATRQVIEWLALPGHHADRAAVVVIGSSAARLIASEQPVGYHVAKAGLVQLVAFYAVTLGRSGIRVNAISSGTIVKEESRGFYAAHPDLEALYQRIVPLGRMCTASDIVDVAMFLLSPQASYLTGQNIIVDGGVSLVWQESLARSTTSLQGLSVVSTPTPTDQPQR